VRTFTAYDVGILLLSGFIGIAVADTLFFYSLNLVGVGIISIVDCLYSPMVFFFSAILLSESLTPLQYAGGGMILVAVLITSRHKPPEGRTRLQLLAGIALGVLDMAFLAFGIVIAKRVLEGFPIVWASLIRLVGGTAALAVIVALLPQRRAIVSVFSPSRSWKFILPASVLGAYLSLLLWIGGFKYTKASVAGILNQTSSIFALILATLILKEAFTKKKFAAVVLALAGIVLVFWNG
jgi:drug/metabolite transporter (DMT)-like permease